MRASCNKVLSFSYLQKKKYTFFSLWSYSPLAPPSSSLHSSYPCRPFSTASATPAPVDMSTSKKSKAPVTDTALHIIKGAVVKVLNTPLTLTTEAKSATKGRLTVEYTHPDKPTEHQIAEIQSLTNEKITQNVPVEIVKMERKQAEEWYSKNRVNNTYIYDSFPVPASVTELSLVHIADWNINCCPSDHLQKTGEVGGIKITSVNHRPIKKELEFAFEILSTPPTSASSSSSSAPAAKPAKGKGAPATAAAPVQAGPAPDDVGAVTKQIMAIVGKEGELELAKQVESLLVSMKNTSYASGMVAARQ